MTPNNLKDRSALKEYFKKVKYRLKNSLPT